MAAETASLSFQAWLSGRALQRVKDRALLRVLNGNLDDSVLH
jgi:hypothetical protein